MVLGHSTRLALDTNVLLDLAAGVAEVTRFFELSDRKGYSLAVPSTVLIELDFGIHDASNKKRQKLSEIAQELMLTRWNVIPLAGTISGRGCQKFWLIASDPWVTAAQRVERRPYCCRVFAGRNWPFGDFRRTFAPHGSGGAGGGIQRFCPAVAYARCDFPSCPNNGYPSATTRSQINFAPTSYARCGPTRPAAGFARRARD